MKLWWGMECEMIFTLASFIFFGWSSHSFQDTYFEANSSSYLPFCKSRHYQCRQQWKVSRATHMIEITPCRARSRHSCHSISAVPGRSLSVFSNSFNFRTFLQLFLQFEHQIETRPHSHSLEPYPILPNTEAHLSKSSGRPQGLFHFI
jgi:hypothetical protein